jgi:hypothetical protein
VSLARSPRERRREEARQAAFRWLGSHGRRG